MSLQQKQSLQAFHLQKHICSCVHTWSWIVRVIYYCQMFFFVFFSRLQHLAKTFLCDVSGQEYCWVLFSGLLIQLHAELSLLVHVSPVPWSVNSWCWLSDRVPLQWSLIFSRKIMYDLKHRQLCYKSSYYFIPKNLVTLLPSQ